VIGTNETSRHHWSNNWTSWNPFVADGEHYVYVYNTNSGACTIDKILPGGKDTVELWRYDGAKQNFWTSAAIEIDGKPYLFRHNENGNVSIDGFFPEHFKPKEKATEEFWSGTWSPQWSHFVPFKLKGDPKQYMFSYKFGFGTVAIDRFDASAGDHAITEIWRDDWSTNWTDIEVFYLDGDPYLFQYKAGIGTVAIDKIDSDGLGTKEVWRSQWSLDWAGFTTFQLNGRPYIFQYKHSGVVAIDEVLIDKPQQKLDDGTHEVWRRDWSGTGWTNIVAVEMQGVPYLLSWRKPSNGGSQMLRTIDKVHA
jgi:hypothetical protein